MLQPASGLVCRAHRRERAAGAGPAVLGALARVDERAPQAWPILARPAGQAVVDAGLDDQRVQVAVEVAARRLRGENRRRIGCCPQV
ncbi:MAG: hypothetical protein U0Z44_05475 [Kouleothrix sp.]